jgi:hypothetical protein
LCPAEEDTKNLGFVLDEIAEHELAAGVRPTPFRCIW